MSDPLETPRAPSGGEVRLLTDDPRRPELVFDFPINDALNDAVRDLPGRWFDWRRKNWRVPAERRLAKDIEELLARFPELEVSGDVRHWLVDSARWRALVSVTDNDGEGAFVLRTMSGDPPEGIRGATLVGEHTMVLPFNEDSAEQLESLRGAELDDLARPAARELLTGHEPAPAELSVELGESGEPELVLASGWSREPAEDFRAVSEAHPTALAGRFFKRDASWGVSVPADPALAVELDEFVEAHPEVRLDERARDLLDELRTEHDRAATTVALSYADDSELPDLDLGGELHPFQRAGVRYALERRRTFIADEQGLGKTIQALATIEADDGYPALVVCPASMKLVWERETSRWLPQRTVAVLEGRTDSAYTEKVAEADIVVVNYDILDAHAERLTERGLATLVLDESHYVKNPSAQRTKAAIALARSMPPDALRLALTGTPILNRPEELVSQLTALDRLKDFGSGARLTRRFRAAASSDRLHWNLRAHCYVRRTKAQVLPQLPSKRQETVPVLLSNEQEYRLAESDVIAWLQSLPMDLGSIDAKVAAALRAEQLVRLNSLRQLSARGKLPTALAWIDDFLQSGEPLVVFADHVEIQRAVMERFPDAVHILGADNAEQRLAAIDAFQSEDGPQLIVCSMKAASQGVTLTRASNAAFLELDWTPARHDQAEDRLHRIGQESAVTAWYLLAPETIDETMAELLQRKRSLIDAVTDGRVQDEERLVDAVVRELRGRPFRHLRVVA